MNAGLPAGIGVYLQLLSPSAQAPTKAKDGDAGWDLYTSQHVLVPSGRWADIHTDIALGIPTGWYGQIEARSSTLPSLGLQVKTAVVDAGYRGELFVQVFNPTEKAVAVGVGRRIAQILFLPVPHVIWTQVVALPPSTRGSGGFGSTGS